MSNGFLMVCKCLFLIGWQSIWADPMPTAAGSSFNDIGPCSGFGLPCVIVDQPCLIAAGAEGSVSRRLIETSMTIRRAAPQGAMSPYRSEPYCAESNPVNQGKTAAPAPPTANIHPRAVNSSMNESRSG
jgi:hypothetical protein